VAPQFPKDHMNLALPVEHGFSVTFFFHWGSPFQLDQSWPTPPGDTPMPDPDGSMQGQSQAAGLSPTSANMAVPSGGQVPLPNEPGPNQESPVSSVQSFGLPAAASSKSQPGSIDGGRNGAGRISVAAGTNGVFAAEDAVAVTAGKEAAQGVGGIGNGQLEPAVSSLPAQLVALLDHDTLLNGWLDARSEAPAGVNGSLVAGLIGTDRGAIDQQGNPAIGRTAGSGTDGSALARNVTAVLPNPHGADLIANVLPCDRGALDRAIEQFFKQVDEPDGSGAGGQGGARIVFLSAALAGSFAGLDIVRRRWRHWKAGNDFRVRDSLGAGDHVGFPELPGSWSSRMT
jgi:hypothetical protein